MFIFIHLPDINFYFQDYSPDPKKYNREIRPLERSKQQIPTEVLTEATKALAPFPWDKETDMKVDGAGAGAGQPGLLASLVNKIKSLFFK